MATNDALQSRQLEHSEALTQHPLIDATPKETTFKGINWIENKTILTPTSGFLASGYTHTLNPYVGCGFAGALCGTFCYAQHQHWIVRGRPWGLYGAKHDIRQAYQRDYDRIKRPRQGNPRPLRVYMASSTDPYVPPGKAAGANASNPGGNADTAPGRARDPDSYHAHYPRSGSDSAALKAL
jgi:hypothetical protein